jgi:hypothetical protein
MFSGDKMQDTDEQRPLGDGPAIALGCVVGLIGGALLGGLFLVLLGETLSEVSLILVLHTMLAMMVMGGWTAPSLLPRES